MKSVRWLGLTFLSLMALATCGAPTDPTGPVVDDAAAASPGELVAAKHDRLVVQGGGKADDFSFLSPLARYSLAGGQFDARRSPVVEVCEWKKDRCKKGPVARFTTFDGPRDQVVRVFPSDVRDGVRGFYLVSWDTRKAKLKDHKTYRVTVLVDGTELGHTDFEIEASHGRWLKAWQRWEADPSGPAPVLKKTSIPIAFRIIESTATPTPPSAAWPDEPAGLTVMTDQPWDALGSLGWQHLDRRATSRIARDASAPLSAPNVLEQVYPVGFAGGYSPAVDYYSFFSLPDAQELFIGTWFKVSLPWQGARSGFNVLEYVFLDGGSIGVPMYGPSAGPFDIRVVEGWSGGALLAPNVGDGAVSPGEWHRLELYLRYDSSPGAGDGVVRWWLDGHLVGDYTDRTFPVGAGFTEYQIAPSWGSVGDTKTEADFLRYDHTLISGK